MPGPPNEDTREEYATPDGLELLDQLCTTLLECTLIATVVQDDVDLNLDELITGLGEAQYSARSAFEAASLLHQRADLDSSWTQNRSRPKAIFARHYAAVDAGAIERLPLQPSASLFETMLHGGIELDTRPPAASRPRCASSTKMDTPCRNSAVYLGAGFTAQHCYTHLTPIERKRFDDHQQAVAIEKKRILDGMAERISRAADLVGTNWRRRRSSEDRWLPSPGQ